ncbi:hypothetical protein LTR85_001437 [Meristemomyces frigidus]|nr:hypothetical protein LTR85_001437 [Meristemomyces frigidus]
MDSPITDSAAIVPNTRATDEETTAASSAYMKRHYIKMAVMTALGFVILMSAQWVSPQVFKAERVALDFSWPLQIAVSVLQIGIFFGVPFVRRRFFN